MARSMRLRAKFFPLKLYSQTSNSHRDSFIRKERHIKQMSLLLSNTEKKTVHRSLFALGHRVFEIDRIIKPQNVDFKK